MRGVIFDLDDTLYPRQRYVQSGLAAVARHAALEFGISADDAFTAMRKAPAAGREFQALTEACGIPVETYPALLDVFRAHTPALWLFHDAEETLHELRLRGWSLAILTNGLPDVQAVKIEALGLRGLVDHVVFAEDHAEGGKPHPDTFREALRRLELPADRVVMVGDDAECDIRGGRAAGLRTIRMVREEAHEQACADIVVKLLSDVPRAAEALIPQVSAHAG